MHPSPKKAMAIVDAVVAQGTSLGLAEDVARTLGETAAAVYLTRLSPVKKQKAQEVASE